MPKRLGHRLRVIIPPALASVPAHGDQMLVRVWTREVVLLWARWAFLAALFALLAVFPARYPAVAAVLAIAIVAWSMAASWLLQRPSAERIETVQRLSVALEWLSAMAIVVVFRRELAVVAPAFALVALLPTAMRFRMAGVAAAIVGSAGMVAAWAVLHAAVFRVLERETVVSFAVAWAVALVLAVVTVGLWIRGGQQMRRWERTRHAQALNAVEQRFDSEMSSFKVEQEEMLDEYQRERHGLTRREWELLPLLARPDLRTYREIGDLVDPPITGKTVATYVRRLGEKLGASGGRWIVVHAARERGLLPMLEGATNTEIV